MSYFKYKPSKAQKEAFKKSMDELEKFLMDHPSISASLSRDSFYFELNGQHYRISNHSVEASNRHAFDWTGEQVRDIYHPLGREEDVRYIHASKTRFIEIYNLISSGVKIDGRGKAI